MTSYSHTTYQAYHIQSGKSFGPEGSYEDAAYEALMGETWKLQQIQDIEFATSEELAAALVSTRCGVRFLRAERLTAA